LYYISVLSFSVPTVSSKRLPVCGETQAQKEGADIFKAEVLLSQNKFSIFAAVGNL
jgi:hypothetical protein